MSNKIPNNTETKITPRFNELDERTQEQVNRFVNSCASFRNAPELLDVLTKATHEFQRAMFQHID